MVAVIPTQSHWFIRYKLYHIPFWFVYHYLWWTITIGDAVAPLHNIFNSAYSIKYCFYAVFQAAVVYFNLYFLMPRFLEQGRYVLYIASLLPVVVFGALCINFGYYAGAWLSDRTFQELYGVDPTNYLYFFQINTLPSTTAATTLGMSLKLTKNWVESRRREKDLEREKLELEREKLETELKFLKSQFNPHFLFNTINSIFVLINKNPRLASDSLAKFSDILRYQLYECNEHEILLSHELGFLENFIELQKLRQDHSKLSLVFKNELGATGDLCIAPFILMPFIENAFKHVSKHSIGPNWIRMRLALEHDQLTLDLSNSVSHIATSHTEFIRHSGIGLKNVRRRLELLYPGNHTLEIDKDEDIFHVKLKLGLRERMRSENNFVIQEEEPQRV
jgi:two-component system LytT family sensor kinase